MRDHLRRLREHAARTGLDQAWPALLVGLLLLVGLGLALTPPVLEDEGPRELEDLSVPDQPRAAGTGVEDTDDDGLADSLENYVYGTSPEEPDSNGDGVPDGYLAEFGYHPVHDDARNRTITEPDADQLPPAWNGTWPDRYDMTLRAFHEHTRPDNATGAWWASTEIPSPRDVDRNDDGIPDAWFVRAGLDPYDTPLDEPAPEGDDTLTVGENLELATDPTLRDTDGDGIPDAEEPAIGTDPLAFSTAGVGVADGWLVEQGFDPIDPEGVFADPDRDGLTTAEEFRASLDWMPEASMAELAERGLDPFETDTAGNGIPDGWLVVNELDPLDPDVAERVTQRASDFEDLGYVDEGPEDEQPLGDLALTVRDEYEAAKPDAWNESTDGVWWGGTSPAELDTDGDGLPDAVELRGWYVHLTASVDPSAQAEWVHVSPDPSRADSDTDGLSDAAERRGEADCGDEQRTFPPTHPGRADSTFSELSDREEVCGFTLEGEPYDLGAPDEGGLDPTLADTDGDLIADGREARYWHERVQQARATYPFPDAPYGSSIQMAQSTDRHAGADADTVRQALAPDGDWDGDGLANVVDPDSASALASTRTEACTQTSSDPQEAFLRDGPQIDPSLYRFTDLGTDDPRPPSDPASPDTDGDGLPDAWETEHARWLDDAGTWSLSPADPASGPDATPDGRADPDGDSIRYLAPPDDERSYEHTNLQECLAGTDPQERATDDDGVGDGWKVFWGSRYPDLVSQNDPIVGELADEERSQILSRSSSTSLAPGVPLTGRVPWADVDQPVRYTRHLLAAKGSGACSDTPARVTERLEEATLGEAENAPTDPVEASLCITTPDGEPRLLVPVQGSFNLTWSAVDGTGANPYLDDTDRDGVPDWLEVLVQATPAPADSSSAPSPTRADAEGGFADDGLTLADTHEAWEDALQSGTGNGGPDPRLPDSDHDGLDDGDEVRASFDPRDPRTIRRLGGDGGDADGDGIGDLREIQGWTHTGEGPRFETDPFDPDTDRDGLVDGFVDGDAAEELDARGIAHIQRDDGTDHLGESLYQSDPLDPDTSEDTIPDGWQAYYAEQGSAPDPATDAEGLERAYEAGRPAWWEETDHGPWWWGRAPSAPPCDDLDGDGLSDVNGEDPFPARTDNRYEHESFTTTDPGEARSYVEAAGDPIERLQRAQAWGPEAGDPLAAREDTSCPEGQRASLSFEAVTLDPDPAVLGAQLVAEGRVLQPDGTPAPGVTVLVSTLEPTIDRVVGVGFTDEDGRFVLEGAITAEHTVEVPDDAVYRSTTGGQASWTATVDDLQPGAESHGRDNELHVWTYNTTDHAGAHHAEQVDLQATTDLALEAPSELALADQATVNLTLTDGLDRPIPDADVTLTWEATDPPSTRSLTTDAAGQASLTIPEPDVTGEARLEVRFDGEGPWLASQTATEITVRRPAQLTLEAEPTDLSAGDTLTVSGQLTTEEGPVFDADVELSAGASSTTTATGPEGRFQTRLTVPEDASPGALDIVVEAAASETRAPARATASVQVLAIAHLQAPDDVRVPQTEGALVQGRVLDAQERPIDTTVTLDADGLPRQRSATDGTGAWMIRIPDGLDAGVHRAQVHAAPSGGHAGSQAIVNVTVQAPTAVHLDELGGNATRGGLLTVAGTLVDDRGEPLPDERLVASLPETRREAQTGPEGGFTVDLPVPERTPLGTTRLDVRYEGAPERGLQAARANDTLDVQAPTTLELATRSTPLADPTLEGRLTDEDGEAMPGEEIRVRVLDPDTAALLARSTATTSASGAYNVSLPAEIAQEARQVPVEVAYPGSAEHAASHVAATLNLTTPLVWEAELPERLSHEGSRIVQGTVHEDTGQRVREGRVVAHLDGQQIAQAPVREGEFTLTLDVPESVDPGRHELRVLLDPPGLHARTPLAGPLTVTTSAQIAVDYGDELEPGQPFQAEVAVNGAGGEPLANVTVVYWLAGEDPVPARATTDEDGIARVSGKAPAAEEGDPELRVLARGPTVDEEVGIASKVPVGQPGGFGLLAWGLALGALGALVVAGLLARRRRQQVSQAQEIIEDLVRDLEAGNEYEASVLWAYRNLADHLEDHGFLDRPEHTAREFLHAVQEALPLPADEVDAFVELFEETRYSDRPTRPVHRTQAIQRLHRILERLGSITGGGSS